MTPASDLIDGLVKQVAVHARLPLGSAAAFNAAELMQDARVKLFRRMAEDAAEIARLRLALEGARDTIVRALT